MFIDGATYLEAVERFVQKLGEVHREKKFDAVVAPKRSGLFLGVWASHALGLPLFIPGELRRRGESHERLRKFKRILVVDTAVWRGRTTRKIVSQLGTEREVFTAVIWREGDGVCDFILEPETTGDLLKFFYELRPLHGGRFFILGD